MKVMWHTDSHQVKKDVAWRRVVTSEQEARFRHVSVSSLCEQNNAVDTEKLLRDTNSPETTFNTHPLTSSLSSRSLFRAPTGLFRSLNESAFVKSEKQNEKCWIWTTEENFQQGSYSETQTFTAHF